MDRRLCVDLRAVSTLPAHTTSMPSCNSAAYKAVLDCNFDTTRGIFHFTVVGVVLMSDSDNRYGTTHTSARTASTTAGSLMLVMP